MNIDYFTLVAGLFFVAAMGLLGGAFAFTAARKSPGNKYLKSSDGGAPPHLWIGLLALIANLAILGVELHRLNELNSSQHWLSTQATITGWSSRSDMIVGKYGSPHPFPVYQYSFRIGNKTINGAGILIAVEHMQAHHNGSPITVFVDPRDPSHTLLEKSDTRLIMCIALTAIGLLLSADCIYSGLVRMRTSAG
ncbi:MAG: DUF3592 domain-containing protein [Candidatus Obscuribacterales bacterium]